jgi:branched-chain amino acid transport system substrate-binding protein
MTKSRYLVLSFVGILLNAAPGAAQEAKPILLGVHGDSAKQASYYTSIQRNAIETLIGELNASGVQPVRLVFEDDENNPTTVAGKVEKLAAQSVAFIISIGSSATGVAAQAKAEEMRIPIGSPANNSEALSQPLRRYYFRTGLRDGTTSAALISYLHARHGNPRVAVVRDATQTGLTLSDTFIKALRDGGLQVVATEQITPGAADVTAQALRIKDARAEVVLLSGGSIPDLAGYARAHKLLANPAPMMGTYLFTVPAFIRLSGEAAEGFIYTDGVDPGRPEVKEIEEKLAAKLGNDARNNPSMIHAWEFTRLVVDVIRRAGSTDHEAIRAAMEATLDYPVAIGRAGTRVKFSPENHDLFTDASQVVFRVIQGGRHGPAIEVK